MRFDERAEPDVLRVVHDDARAPLDRAEHQPDRPAPAADLARAGRPRSGACAPYSGRRMNDVSAMPDARQNSPPSPTSSRRSSPVSLPQPHRDAAEQQHRLELVHQEVEQVAERRRRLAQPRELAVGAVEHEREFEHQRRRDQPRSSPAAARTSRTRPPRSPPTANVTWFGVIGVRAQRVHDDRRGRPRDVLGEPVDVLLLLRRPIDGGDLGPHACGGHISTC